MDSTLEKTVVDETEISPTVDETTSTPAKETTDGPDTSNFVPVPKITKENVNFVPSFAHSLLEEVVMTVMLHQNIECTVPKSSHLLARRLLDQ